MKAYLFHILENPQSEMLRDATRNKQSAIAANVTNRSARMQPKRRISSAKIKFYLLFEKY